jgi:hypothetical protein
MDKKKIKRVAREVLMFLVPYVLAAVILLKAQYTFPTIISTPSSEEAFIRGNILFFVGLSLLFVYPIYCLIRFIIWAARKPKKK